jgi:hypothetical protein
VAPLEQLPVRRVHGPIVLRGGADCQWTGTSDEPSDGRRDRAVGRARPRR